MLGFKLRHGLIVFLFAAFSCLWAQEPQPSAADNGASDLVKQGQKLNGEGNYDAALATFKRAIEASPGSYEAFLGAGIALDLKGSYEEARQNFSKAIDLASPDARPQPLRAMAVSYAFEANAYEAAKFEQRVLDTRLAKNDFTGAGETANELARIYLESGDPDHAFKWYRMGHDTALRKQDMSDDDKNLWAFRWESAQARIAARRGKAPEAQQHVSLAKAALDKANNPDQARFFPYLTGYVAFFTGDYKAGVNELQKADQRDPFVLTLLGQAYEKSGDQAKAADCYRKALAANGHSIGSAFARPLARKKLAAAGGA
jgi:tetratricopeptide (TPR) repeat protein